MSSLMHDVDTPCGATHDTRGSSSIHACAMARLPITKGRLRASTASRCSSTCTASASFTTPQQIMV